MIEAILNSYKAFFMVIAAMFERPHQFYQAIVKDIDVKSMLGFYIQILIAVVAFNEIVFTKDADPESSSFYRFSLVVGAMNLLVSALISALVFWALLKIFRERAVFSQTSKYIFVFYMFSAIVTLFFSTLSTYVEYALTNGFDNIGQPVSERPWFSDYLFYFEMYGVPMICMMLFTGLLFSSSGRSVKIAGSFICTLLVQIVFIAPATNTLWLNILQINY